MPEAQLAIAECYRIGRGVARDESIARHWYEQAARKGNQAASQMLERTR